MEEFNYKTSEWDYYTSKSILGNQWAIFHIMIGGRETGKSYCVLEHFLWQFFNSGFKKSFVWIRLTEASMKKLLKNNAQEFIDYKLMEQFNLGGKLSTSGNSVFYTDDEGNKHEMAQILALSTFYSDKGIAKFKDQELDKELFGANTFNIACDEFQRERSEKNTFDITYAFVNQLENLVRHRSDVRVFLLGNTVEQASDVLTLFNFIPEKFGRFKLKKKKCVIDNIPPSSKYLDRRSGSIANLLTPEASTFSNIREIDKSLIDKRRRLKPTYIIKMDGPKDCWFTVWDGRVISKYNNEKIPAINMRPIASGVFNKEAMEEVIQNIYYCNYRYSDLFVQAVFEKQVKQLKGIK